ncbi:ATP-binding protein [Candidatus Roizmanbacteria bacterium]|nr:ATP-binding protein [Candidatus Roizmanbacteria bacterium]
MIIFELKNLKTDEAPISTFAQILANFANQSPPSFLKRMMGHRSNILGLEIAAYNQRIYFYLIAEDHLKTYFQSQLTSFYPKAWVEATTEYFDHIFTSAFISYGQLTLSSPYYYPLNTYKALKDADPLASVLGILSKLNEGETGLVQFVLTPAGPGWRTGARGMVERGITDATTKHRRPLPNESLIKEKIAQNGLRTGIRVAIGAGSKLKAESLLNDLSGSFGVFARGDGNSLSLKKPGLFGGNSLLTAIEQRQPNPTPKFQVLNTDELATLFHLPGDKLKAIKNISWGGQVISEAPENLPISDLKDQEDINFFGKTEFKNQQKVFGIKRNDRRRHMYIIGKTGTGKTTLIANMAINDMRNGEGLAVIDPHGDLSEILLNYVPKSRINDVAYLDPSDTEFPFHLNPLELPENVDKAQAELVVSGIVSIFYKLYHYSWGPRLEYMLRNALLTLTNVQDATIADIPPLLADEKFRRKIVDKLDDKVLLNFWNREYAQMSDRLRSEAIAPIQNKVGQFVTSPMIRNIIGHPKSTIDFRQMMDERKIIICNLSQGKLGEDNAALLGAMFITKMQLSAMSRVYQKEEDRADFYLYVDEFQNFATQSFLKILSEARKYRLNLMLANQYVGQVDKEVQKAIFGNVGSIVSFLVGAEDAKALSFEYGKAYEAEEFVNLGNYQMLLKMAIDGLTSSPFYAHSLPLPANANQNRDKVVRVSRERYGRKS